MVEVLVVEVEVVEVLVVEVLVVDVVEQDPVLVIAPNPPVTLHQFVPSE